MNNILAAQIDEDTDRDRYMSPLEAKQYGLIDHVIGGDDAGFKVWLLPPLYLLYSVRTFEDISTPLH